MVDDPDIFRAAKLIIDQHGEEAAAYAAGRADLLLKWEQPGPAVARYALWKFTPAAWFATVTLTWRGGQSRSAPPLFFIP
jgi:hypothetical protein